MTTVAHSTWYANETSDGSGASAGSSREDIREDLSRYFRGRVVAQAEVQFDVNLDIVWQTVTEDLPDLVAKLEQLTEP